MQVSLGYAKPKSIILTPTRKKFGKLVACGDRTRTVLDHHKLFHSYDIYADNSGIVLEHHGSFSSYSC